MAAYTVAGDRNLSYTVAGDRNLSCAILLQTSTWGFEPILTVAGTVIGGNKKWCFVVVYFLIVGAETAPLSEFIVLNQPRVREEDIFLQTSSL